MEFIEYRKFFKTEFKDCGFSLGIHFSQTKKRVDIHFLNNVYSFGKVPIYEIKVNKETKKLIATSDYYHNKTEDYKRKYLGI